MLDNFYSFYFQFLHDADDDKTLKVQEATDTVFGEFHMEKNYTEAICKPSLDSAILLDEFVQMKTRMSKGILLLANAELLEKRTVTGKQI